MPKLDRLIKISQRIEGLRMWVGSTGLKMWSSVGL